MHPFHARLANLGRLGTRFANSPRARRAAAFLFVLVACLSTPLRASAHGIGGDAVDRSAPGFVGLGIEHMLLGWDHLLFIGGVVLLAGSPRRAGQLISVFVAGHSLTLIAASVAGWEVSAEVVDAVIAASVVFVGGVAMFGRPKRYDWFGAAVFGFGLVHGLGLATRLHALGLAEDGLILKVIAFNIGIEIGQMTAIVGMLGLFAVASMTFGRSRHEAMTKGAAAALVLVGSMAAAVLTYRAVGDTSDSDATPVDVALGPQSTCTIAGRAETFPATGGHTAQAFYGPEDQVPLGDFGHSLADGYVLVMYPPDTSEDALADLRSFMNAPAGIGVLAGPVDEGSVVKVHTVRQTMTCDELEVESVRKFTVNWNNTRTQS